jgi:hypothetical protein
VQARIAFEMNVVCRLGKDRSRGTPAEYQPGSRCANDGGCRPWDGWVRFSIALERTYF